MSLGFWSETSEDVHAESDSADLTELLKTYYILARISVSVYFYSIFQFLFLLIYEMHIYSYFAQKAHNECTVMAVAWSQDCMVCLDVELAEMLVYTQVEDVLLQSWL